MEQLYLFAPEEMIRNNAIRTLLSGEFHQSRKYWTELKHLDPGNTFQDTALDICRYWNALYNDDQAFKQENPLELYRKWREFEQHIEQKEPKVKTITRQMKENLFLSNMGLENPTPMLRESFNRSGVTVLDLLMEIEQWRLAVQEIKALRKSDSCHENGPFFLKCSKVYYRAGNIDVSRRFLLHAFWDQPDAIELTDIVDADLLNGLSGLYPDYETGKGLVELIPFVGLITGLMTIPLEDRQDYLSKLRKDAETCEESGDTSPRIRYRLFSLYAWQAELAKLIASDFVGARNKMKLLDYELFQHYMEGKGNLK